MKNMNGIIWLDSVDSTNEEAKRRLHYIDNMSVLSAVSQTSGRGQRGNHWTSEAGRNLTFTMVLDFSDNGRTLWEVKAVEQFAISMIAANSVVELLDSYGIGAKIKWPNDIYVGSYKICGMLIENSLMGAYLTSSMIGIGLNVNQTSFPDDLPNPISMKLCTSLNYDVESVLNDAVAILRRNFGRYMKAAEEWTGLREEYQRYLWRKDEVSFYIDTFSGRMFKGVLRGISGIGNLMLEDVEKGVLREYAFKEISYVL